MNEFHDYTHHSASKEISSAIKGKTITRFEDDDIGGDDFLVFHFDDSSILRIRYDWIYEWQFVQSKQDE